MSNILLPGQPDPNDPMVQAAARANQQQAELNHLIKGFQDQMFVSVFTQLAVGHFATGETLNLETGRALANEAASMAQTVVNGYAGFMFEKMGLAKMEKVDPE